MRIIIFLILHISISISLTFSQTYSKPSIAVHCGKCTQHRDVITGEWTTKGCKDCPGTPEDELEYCKNVYPSLNIISTSKSTDTSISVGKWCNIGSTPPCKGHNRKVSPILCVAAEGIVPVINGNEGKKDSRELLPRNTDCLLERDTGFCKAAFERWYYNSKSKSCEIFTYGGCNGNANRFETKQECEQKCSPADKSITDDDSTPAKCLLEKVIGPCRALISRYYFNKNTKKCEVFYYGGCSGNENNFKTQDDCQSSCITEVPVPRANILTPPLLGVGPVLLDDTMTLGKDDTVGKTDDDEVSTPEIDSVCLLDKYIGDCRGSFSRYYYDKTTKTCKHFTYGGCGATSSTNNFLTQDSCEARCLSGKKKTDSDIQASGFAKFPLLGVGPVVTDEETIPFNKENVCSLERETGPCRALFRRFYFDNSLGTCKGFIYGGCQGNENNFETVEDCEKKCKGKSSSPKPVSPPEEKDVTSPTEEDDIINKYTNLKDSEQEDTLFDEVMKYIDSQHQTVLNEILQDWDEQNSKTLGEETNSKVEELEQTLQEKLRNLNANHVAKKDEIQSLHDSRLNDKFAEKREKEFNKLMQSLNTEEYGDISENFKDYLIAENDERNHFTLQYQRAVDASQHDTSLSLSVSITLMEERVNNTLQTVQTKIGQDSAVSLNFADFISQFYPTPPIDSELADSLNDNQEIIDFIDGIPFSMPENDDDSLVEIENELFDDDEDLQGEFDYDAFDKKFIDPELTDNDYIDYPHKQKDPFDLDVDIMDPEPQPLINDNTKWAYAGGKGWFFWAGIAIGALFLIVVIAIFASNRRNAELRATQRVMVPTENTHPKAKETEELTPEQKQLLLMQQYGYENPTYKFFEKQNA